MKQTFVAFTCLILASTSLFLSCGGGSGTSARSIGAGGGVVSSADGVVSLNVPPGALAEDVSIEIEDQPLEQLGSAVLASFVVNHSYVLRPNDLDFLKPATISLKLPAQVNRDDSEVSFAVPALLYRSDGLISVPQNQTMFLDSDQNEVVLTGEITHFSDVWDATPRSASIQVTVGDLPEKTSISLNSFAPSVKISNSNNSVYDVAEIETSDLSGSPVGAIDGSSLERSFGELAPGNEHSFSDQYSCEEEGEGFYQLSVKLRSLEMPQLAALLGELDGAPSTAYDLRFKQAVECDPSIPTPTPTPTPTPEPTPEPTPSAEPTPTSSPTPETTPTPEPTAESSSSSSSSL